MANKNPFLEKIEQANKAWAEREDQLGGLLQYPITTDTYDTAIDKYNPMDPSSDLYTNAHNIAKEEIAAGKFAPTLQEAQMTDLPSGYEKRRFNRWDRAINRAKAGKMVLDPMYRRALKQHHKELGTYGDTGRPMLRDYKFGTGDWLRAMRDWRGTELPNKALEDSQQDFTSNIAPENQDYWNNISSSALKKAANLNVEGME